MVGRSGDGRPATLLGTPAKSVYRLIMEAPDLDNGGESPPPPEEEVGDRRPEPEPLLIGMMAFMVGFAGVTALRYARQLVRIML
jgi:hypothetical protein